MSDVIDSAEIDRIERGPDRIWATVNGASTRVPDGGRQLLGGWSEDSERPRAIEYVRADLYAALVTEVMEGREEKPVAFMQEDGSLLVPEGSPIKELWDAIPKPEVGKKLLPLYARNFLKDKETDNAGE